jgi:hypothetical protein
MQERLYFKYVKGIVLFPLSCACFNPILISIHALPTILAIPIFSGSRRYFHDNTKDMSDSNSWFIMFRGLHMRYEGFGIVS